VYNNPAACDDLGTVSMDFIHIHSVCSTSCW